MDWFGLGILLQARDNASSSILNVNNSLNTLTGNLEQVAGATQSQVQQINNSLSELSVGLMSGMAMQQLGQSVMGVGGSMISSLVGVSEQTIKTGAQFENWRKTLKALYGDAQKATEILDWGLNLAAKTPFEIEDVTQAIIGFKAVGAEVNEMFENSEGISRSFLEYVGDLAALRPDVGLQGVLLGIRNLLGGDGGRSLMMRLDVDLSKFTDEGEWGSTTEEIMKQLVTASDRLANGLMNELEGTWDQLLSNLEDQKTKILLMLSDSGIFDAFKGTLQYFSDAVNNLEESGKLENIAKNISSALEFIWKPMDFVIKRIIDLGQVIANLMAEHPMIAKMVTTFLALVGGLTALMGVILVVGGTFLVAVNGLKLFLLSLQGLKSSLLIVGSTMKGFLLSLGKFALVGGLVYGAWKSDFLGVKSILTTFMSNIYKAFSYSAEITNMSANDMKNALDNLDKTTFSGWLTYRLVQLRQLWISLCDAWSDNTLSDENFQKARELGLLPLIETILDVKMRAEAFFEGFMVGLKKVSKVVQTVVTTIGEWIGKVVTFLFPVKEGIDEVNDATEGLNLQPWKDFGEIMSYVASALAGIWAISKVVGIIKTVASGIVSVGSAIGGVISSVWGVITSVIGGIGTLLGVIGGAVTAILGFFGIVISAPAWVVGAVTVAIAGLVAVVIKYWDNIKEYTVKAWEWIKEKSVAIWEGMCDIFSSVGDFFKDVWVKVKDVAKNVLDAICDFFEPFVTFLEGVGQIIFGIFQVAWNLVKGVVVGVCSAITLVIGLFVEGVIAVAKEIGTFFSNLWNGIKEVAQTVWNFIYDSIIKPVWNGICSLVESAYNNITSIWSAISSFFSDLWNGVYNNIIKPVWDAICSLLDKAYQTATGIWSKVTGFFSNLWQGVLDITSIIWEGIKSLINHAKDVVTNVWSKITDFFSGIWSTVSGITSSVWGNISNIITGVFNVVSSVWSGLTGVFDSVWSKIRDSASSFFAWLGEKFSWVGSLIDGVVGAFSSIKDGISSGVGNVISGAKKLVGLNTGGYVKTEGIAMLHPNEVVVNDELTQGLRTFLDSQKQGSPLVPNNIPQTVQNIDINPVVIQQNDMARGVSSAPVHNNSEEIYNSISNTNTYNNSRTTDRSSSTESVDNSITFSEGAIQITMTNGNDTDINALVKKIADKLKKEQNLRKTLNYKPQLA